MKEPGLDASDLSFCTMMNDQHVPISRLYEVAVDSYEMLTDVEQAHVTRCTNCLAVFEALVMPARRFWNEQEAS